MLLRLQVYILIDIRKMGNEVFLAPRLTGLRFDDHTIPVNMLEDFSAIEELVIEVAKGIYLVENPNRKRVPKGFSDGVYLKLENIQEGSTIPKFMIASMISLNSMLPLDSFDNFSYFEKAKEKIISIISSVNQGIPIDEEFQKYLIFFNKIGKNLLDDENIDFGYNIVTREESNAVLNKIIRKKILLSREEKHEYSDSIKLFALIPSINQKEKIFSIETDEGSIVESELTDTIRGTVFSAFNEYKNKTYVSLKGTGIYNFSDKLLRIEEIESMDILDSFDVTLRINYLSKIPNNWYNQYSKAPQKRLLFTFNEFFNSYYSSHLQLPAIFPTVEGNIQLEWKKNNKNVILDIDLNTLISIFFYYDDNDDNDEHEEIINLKIKEGWSSLNSLIENKI